MKHHMQTILDTLWSVTVALLIIAAITILVSLIGCSHPNTIHADRVFVDDGHVYRAYRNDRQGIITHAGDCPNPIHFCEGRKTP